MPIRPTRTILALLALTPACTDPSAPADSSGESTSSGADDSDGSDGPADETSASSETSQADSSTGDPPPEPPLDDPWTPVADESFDLRLGPVRTVYEPPASFDLGSFPFATSAPAASGVPVSRVIVSFSENEDEADAEIVTRAMATTDLGASYVTLDEGAPVTNATPLEDSSLVAVGFVPQWRSGATTATLDVQRSFDGGLSWASEQAAFDAGETIRGLRFHRGMVRIPSGPDAGILLVAFYALLGSDQTRTIGLAASDDDGATWERWGTIAPPNDPVRTYDETTFEYADDGTLVAVTRAYEDGTLGPLLVSRSNDDGKTFSPVEPIMLAIDDAAPAPRVGVDPGLLRLPNAAMLLVGGRPDNFIAVSADDGQTWPDGTITYVNKPAMGHPAHGSSGYQALAIASSHRAMLFGDNCANSWGCPASDSGWTVDGEYRIWSRLVDVAPADPGRIDLATAVQRAEVDVTSDLQPDDDALGMLSLFDGSLAPGSVLRGAGVTRIVFEHPVPITRLALASVESSAPAVVTLFDGTQWIDPGIATSADGDRSLHAWLPPGPRAVEEIRIETPDGGSLAELELYTTTNSFENEALDLPPRGALEAELARVVEVAGASSRQAVRLHDDRDDAMARLTFELPPDATASAFRLKADALPGSALFGLADEDGPLIHLALDGRGGLRRFDGRQWQPVLEAGSVDPFQGVSVELRVDGTIFIGDDTAVVQALRPAVADRVYITSTGTAPVGVDIVVDDLRLFAGQ